MYGDLLTTAARIKARLGITASDFDDLLASIILGVTARIETMCGRHFAQATHTDELHDGSSVEGTARTFLILKNAPVQTIDAVQYRAGSISDPNWTALDEDTYSVDLGAGLIHRRAGFPSGFQNIRVTYDAGYAEEEGPAELVEVCEQVVVKLFKRRESEGKTGETFGESSITYSEKWFTDDQRAAIKNYRRGYYL